MGVAVFGRRWRKKRDRLSSEVVFASLQSLVRRCSISLAETGDVGGMFWRVALGTDSSYESQRLFQSVRHLFDF